MNLCPIHQHPELVDYDDTAIQRFAAALQVELHRNWDGRPATSPEDAWRIRAHLDTERRRTAEADTARLEQVQAEEAVSRGPLRRRLEAQARRSAAQAALAATDLAFEDERFRDWDERASEKGDAMFAAVDLPAPVDNRTPLERLKDKVAAR